MRLLLLDDAWNIAKRGIEYFDSFSGVDELVVPFRNYAPHRPFQTDAECYLQTRDPDLKIWKPIARPKVSKYFQGLSQGDFFVLYDRNSPSELVMTGRIVANPSDRQDCHRHGSLLLAAEYGGYWMNAYICKLLGNSRIEWYSRKFDKEVHLNTIGFLAMMPDKSEVHIHLKGYCHSTAHDLATLRWEGGILTESRISLSKTIADDLT